MLSTKTDSELHRYATTSAMNMNIKNCLAQIPLVVNMHRTVDRLLNTRSNNKILEQLGNTFDPQGRHLKEALKSLRGELSQSDQAWYERIEAERTRLLTQNISLVDGSLGDGGLYDDGVTIHDACSVSKSPKSALLLFLLTRFIRPLTIIELGTNVGISSAYIGAALKANGQNGRIITLDASPYRLRLAKEVHHNLGIDNISYVEGLFADTLTPALTRCASVDLAFIDGHHHYQPTLDYFENILTFSNPDTVFVFDDIRWSNGMRKAWSQIQTDDRLGLILDLSSIGVCTRRQQNNSQRFALSHIDAF